MNPVMMDFFTANGSQGDVANAMMANGRLDFGMMRPWAEIQDVNGMLIPTGRAFVTQYKGGDPKNVNNYVNRPIQVNATTLRRDEWIQLDEVLVTVARERLGGVQDLIDNNLVFNLGNAMGTTVLEWHDVSDSMSAEMTMDGVTRAKGDRPKYGTNYLPVPIIHADYEINARVLAASRNMGNPLDTTMAEQAGRRVMEKLENLLFTSTTYSFGGGTIYSYLNFPNRNPVTLTEAWTASGKSATEIISDVVAMKQAAIDDRKYGPYMLYVPTGYETLLDEDYNATTPGTTIRERILKIDKIKGIKVIDTLPADNVLLVQMTTDTVRLVRGMGLQNVEWQTEGNMITKYKVMTIQVPQIRSDQEGHCGIVHLAAASS